MREEISLTGFGFLIIQQNYVALKKVLMLNSQTGFDQVWTRGPSGCFIAEMVVNTARDGVIRKLLHVLLMSRPEKNELLDWIPS